MTKEKVTVKGSNYKKIVITQVEKDSLMSISKEAAGKGEHSGISAFIYLNNIDRFKKTLSSLGNPKKPSVVISPVSPGQGKYTVYVGAGDIELVIGKPTPKTAKQKTAAPSASSSPKSSAPAAPKQKTTKPSASSGSSTPPEEDEDDSGEQKSSPGYYYTKGKNGPVRRRMRTTSDYERQDITASKSLDQLTAERVAGGQSMGGAFGSSISEKTKAKASKFKRKFDPINLLSKLPFGDTMAASYAKKKGRLEDLSYLTGVTPRIDELGDDEVSPTMERQAKVSSKTQTASKVTSGGNIGGIAPILNVIAKNSMAIIGMARDLNVIRQNVVKLTEHFGIKASTKADMQMLKEKELGEKTKVQTGYTDEGLVPKSGSASSSEEQQQEDERRHKELIEAIQGIGTEKKTAKKEKDEKSGGLMGMISGFMGGAGDAVKGLAGMAKSLIALAASLWIISKALQNFSKISWGDIFKGMTALAALAATTKLLKKVDAWKTLLALGASMWIISKALDNFAKIEWESIAKGIVAIGALAATTKLLTGGMGTALSLIVLAGGVYAISKALQSFSDLDWSTIIKGITTVGILAAGAAVLSGFAIPIAVAAAAIGLLGGAIWVLGKGLESVSEGFDSFMDNIQKLSQLNGEGLLKAAAGISALSIAMLAFGSAQMVTALGNLVTNFLSLGQDSPVEQLQKIGAAGAGIEKAADGMERLADAMNKFSSVDPKNLEKVLGTLDKFPAIRDAVLNAPAATTKPSTKSSRPSASNVPKTTEASSGTLKNVSSQDIQSHPKFKQYYEEALSINPNDKQAAYQEASMRVKEDMVKAKPVSQAQPLAARMNNSVKENIALTSSTSMMQSPTIVNAPKTTVVNNSSPGGGGGGVRMRNDEPILTRLQYQNIRPV